MDVLILVVTIVVIFLLISRRRHHDEVESDLDMAQRTIFSGSRDPKTYQSLLKQTWWLHNRLYPAIGCILFAAAVITYLILTRHG